jgi:hypothetical protein
VLLDRNSRLESFLDGHDHHPHVSDRPSLARDPDTCLKYCAASWKQCGGSALLDRRWSPGSGRRYAEIDNVLRGATSSDPFCTDSSGQHRCHIGLEAEAALSHLVPEPPTNRAMLGRT